MNKRRNKIVIVCALGLSFSAGMAVAKFATLGEVLFQTNTPPKALQQFSQGPVTIRPLALEYGDWHAWYITSTNGYRQVAYEMPGQPGVLLGELLDGNGVPVGRKAAQIEERSQTTLAEVEESSHWISMSTPYPSSPIQRQQHNIQQQQAGIEQDSPVYIMLDPTDPLLARYREELLRLLEENPDSVRVIPTPAMGIEAFDALHAVMEKGEFSSVGANDTSFEVLVDFLEGHTPKPVASVDDAAHERAFQLFSANVALQSQLGMHELPSVIHQSAESEGIVITSLPEWLQQDNLKR